MKSKLFVFMLVLNSVVYAQGYTDLYGDYLGQTPPGDTPVVFAEGIVSTHFLEHSTVSFSPDGDEIFWRVEWGWGIDRSDYDPASWVSVKTMKRIENQWTQPMETPFAHRPVYSHDGQCLYLSDYVVEKEGDVWGKPQSLGLLARFPELKTIYDPTITNNGTLYFSSDTKGMGRLADHVIYRAKRVDGAYATVEKLPPSINLTSSWNYSPFIAPDESYIIFVSNRPGSLDNVGDLYISFHNVDEDTWSEPTNMGVPINTRGQESSPGLSPDGQYLFYTRPNSGRQADVFWVNTKAYLPDPMGSVVNMTMGIRFATIQTAIKYAYPGNEIVIESGIYHESLTIDSKDIILRAEDPNDPLLIGSTIIQGNGKLPVLTLSHTSAACCILGLTLRAGSVGISGTTSDAFFSHCRIMDNVSHGLVLVGSNPDLQNCLITANGGHGIAMQALSGKIIRGGSTPSTPCDPMIENCYIVDNGGLALSGGSPILVGENLIE